MNIPPRYRLERLKREKKMTGRKLKYAVKKKNWTEAKSQHFWFHYLGDQISKLEQEN